MPGLFGPSMALVIGLALVGGFAVAKHSYDKGIRLEEQARVRAAQEKLNERVEQEAEVHRLYLVSLYAGYAEEADALAEDHPDEPVEGLPQCPANCVL